MPKYIKVRKSPIHGYGVFAKEKIPKGTRLIEYKGKRRTHEEADELAEGDPDSGHTFLFTLNDDYIVDANKRGNEARWINHSCEPNCEAVIEEHPNGKRKKDRIYIETTRTIAKGEELTYDYGITLAERHTKRMKEIWACRCGHASCTGTMLKPKR